MGRRAGAAAVGGGVAVGVLGAWVYITGGRLGGRVPGYPWVEELGRKACSWVLFMPAWEMEA